MQNTIERCKMNVSKNRRVKMEQSFEVERLLLCDVLTGLFPTHKCLISHKRSDTAMGVVLSDTETFSITSVCHLTDNVHCCQVSLKMSECEHNTQKMGTVRPESGASSTCINADLVSNVLTYL